MGDSNNAITSKIQAYNFTVVNYSATSKVSLMTRSTVYPHRKSHLQWSVIWVAANSSGIQVMAVLRPAWAMPTFHQSVWLPTTTGLLASIMCLLNTCYGTHMEPETSA